MKRFSTLIVLSLLLASCGTHKKGPDVSGIPMKLELVRFDQHFFSLDTNQLVKGLQELAQQDKDFYLDYMNYILGVSGIPTDSITQKITREFLKTYWSIFDSVQPVFKHPERLVNETEKAYRYVKYYFPRFNPGKLWFYLGPFDSPGVAAVRSGMAVGLHQFAGPKFFAYQSPQVQGMFPDYLSRRFDAAYIIPNTIKAVAEDLFPDKSAGLPLIEQMVEKGKYWYLLDLLLPDTEDSLRTGYTVKQLKWCQENEGQIWSHLLRTEDLNSLNPVVIQNYIGEAPFTQGLSQEDSPGNLGPWIGRQIVRRFAEKFSELSPQQIMNTPPAELLEKARYKPK